MKNTPNYRCAEVVSFIVAGLICLPCFVFLFLYFGGGHYLSELKAPKHYYKSVQYNYLYARSEKTEYAGKVVTLGYYLEPKLTTINRNKKISELVRCLLLKQYERKDTIMDSFDRLVINLYKTPFPSDAISTMPHLIFEFEPSNEGGYRQRPETYLKDGEVLPENASWAEQRKKLSFELQLNMSDSTGCEGVRATRRY